MRIYCVLRFLQKIFRRRIKDLQGGRNIPPPKKTKNLKTQGDLIMARRNTRNAQARNVNVNIETVDNFLNTFTETNMNEARTEAINAIAQSMSQSQLALPEGAGETFIQTAAQPEAQARAESRTTYSAAMFNLKNPASQRLPLLAAHILEALAHGAHSTCTVYNYLRDECGWSHLPGSVQFRADTQAMGLLSYAYPRQNSKRTVAVAGNNLAAIAAAVNA